jgi:CRISPR/Cas system-associated exonuclease Cas4 (RecB family)
MSSYAKARAYSIFYLEEAGFEHNHDKLSAIATASTHDIELEKSSDEYLNLALQEISHAEGLLEEESKFRSKLRRIRETLREEKYN